MNEVVINREASLVTVSLIGRVDSEFVLNYGDEVFATSDKDNEITFDFEQVEYISSAGLRLVLKCAKNSKSVQVINANESVYEIFSMSGFTEIIKVKRALRVLSIEGKQLIGEGANGKVYRYDVDTIIKVYKDWSNLSYIENEISMSKKAFMLKVPTAIPFDIVKIKEGGYGCVYELLKSDVMSNIISKNPEKTPKFTKLFASALSSFLHTETYDDALPKKTEYVNEWIQFFEENKIYSPEVISKIKALISTVENGHTLVHGDFHINNIMFQDDEPIIIDMDTLGVGHPIFELAYCYYSMVGFDELNPEKTISFFGVDHSVVNKIYFDTFDIVFSEKTAEEKKDIQSKIEFLSHLRISYRANHHTPKDPLRAENSTKYIIDHVDKLTTLDFKL